jgi:hypothetical protein
MVMGTDFVNETTPVESSQASIHGNVVWFDGRKY